MELKAIDRQFYKIVGEQLNARRRELGYTLGDVAKLLGVSRQTYDYYEMGLRKIPCDKWDKICEILEIYSGIDIQVKIGL